MAQSKTCMINLKYISNTLKNKNDKEPFVNYFWMEDMLEYYYIGARALKPQIQ